MSSTIRFCSIILFLFIATCIIHAQEQEEPKYGWQNNIVGTLNLTQVSFSNWSQGGENTFAWQMILDNKFVNDQEKYNWSTSGKFSFGKSKVGDSGTRKSIDEIKIESVLTYKLGTLINPYAAVTGLTQFAAGYQYGDDDSRVKVSSFLDPGYFTQSAGIGIEPTKGFKTRLGLSFKETVTSDFPVPYADDIETTEIEKTRTEVGAESVTDFTRQLSENTVITSKLELFSNMKAFDEIDLNWDNLLTAKISKYINVNINVRLFYDKNISVKRQINQSLAIGLSYTIL